MLLERIVSRGLAHFSYLVGEGTEAVVIDPRRDCNVYVDMVKNAGMKIIHILETHRNEDYVVGSMELAARTDAEVWHAEAQLQYGYGRPVTDGQVFKAGGLCIEAMHTPGHTPGSMSYLLKTPKGEPHILFSGDTVFAGDVGRVDLPGPDRMAEMASLMYESIFERILPLGDHVILCPAHGAGSACGSSIAGRLWTTLGLERRLSPKLKAKDRDEFVSAVAVELERPPYFRMMEKLNLDVRSELAFGAAHVPSSLFIWQDGVPSYAGWFLRYGEPIYLVTPGPPAEVVPYLVRMGFDDQAGYMSGGLLSWHMAGRESNAVRMLTVQELCRQLDADMDRYILDVRGDEELDSDGRIPGANHIHITLLPEHFEEIPRDRAIHIFCGSGLRSMTAASLLLTAGFRDVAVVLGGLAGWSSRTCPIA
jgi:hydroxyacylglutathione hydrolase